MKVLKKTLQLTQQEYYAKHLEIINSFLPTKLTPKEIEILSNYMSLKGDIALDRFGTTANKFVRNKMGISMAGLSNYMKSLKLKGFIVDNDILPVLYPDKDNQLYQFKITNIDNYG